MRNRLKIAMVFSWSIFDQRGGAERIMCEMASELTKRGHCVTVLSPDKQNGKPAYPIDDRVKLFFWGEGLACNKISKIYRNVKSWNPDVRIRRSLRRFYELDEKVFRLKDFLSKLHADVVIAYSFEAAYLVLRAIGDHIPVVTMSHTYPKVDYLRIIGNVKDEDGIVSYLLKNNRVRRQFELYNNVVARSTIVQVLMPEFIDEVRRIYPNVRVVCIPNAVAQYSCPSKLDRNVIINVARIIPVKRQHLIVQAFALLKNKFPNWVVEIWGQEQDPYCNKLRQLIYSNGLEDRVKICGVSNKIEEKLEKASIILMTSSIEGFCLGMVEAMAKGLPAVGCKTCPAVNSIIKSGENGFLCDETPESIAEALALLMSDIELRRRLGANARISAKAYTPQIIWDQWESLLTEISESEEIKG